MGTLESEKTPKVNILCNSYQLFVVTLLRGLIETFRTPCTLSCLKAWFPRIVRA